MSPAIELCHFVAGFVAAEGCFTRTDNRFRFAVALGSKDGTMCDVLAEVFGVGVRCSSPRRKPHFDDEEIFHVQAIRALVNVVVPFMDVYLPASHKREQYLEWRVQLLEFWEHGARRRRTCTVDGCDAPQRAKALCRHHYYERFDR